MDRLRKHTHIILIEVGFVYVVVEEIGVTNIGSRKKETWSNKGLKQAVVTNGV